MNQFKRLFLPLAAVFAAVILLLLRQWQLIDGFTADGLPLRTASTVVLIGASALFVLLWALLSRTLPPAAAFPSRRNPAAGVAAMLGAAAVALGSLLTLYHHAQAHSLFSMLVDGLGLLAALCLCVGAGMQFTDREPHPAVRIIPYVFLMLRLIVDFRGWSSDPIILDYCFRHFTLICSLCGLYRFTDFLFEKGKRRLTAFWSMSAVGFGAAALPGLAAADALLYAGLALTLLGVLIRLPDAE